MADGGQSQDKSAGDYVPTWGGQSSTLRAFEKAIELWLASLDLQKTTGYNLAARLLLRQRGAGSLRGEEFDIKDLEYQGGPDRGRHRDIGADASGLHNGRQEAHGSMGRDDRQEPR